MVFSSHYNIIAYKLCHHFLEDIDLTRLNLPNLPQATYANTTVYSKKYGLFSVGGIPLGNEVFNLQKRSDAENVTWNKLKKMKNEHYYPSVCIMNEKQLFVATGYGTHNFDSWNKSTKIEMYSLENEEWSQLKDCKIKRAGSGIFYDTMQETVYLGGGDAFYDNFVEYYNIHKNKWSLLDKCKLKHSWNPVIWKDDDQNILYIASIASNGMEFIDLRESNAMWTIKYGPCKSTEKRLKLEEVFDTEFQVSRHSAWLLPINC